MDEIILSEKEIKVEAWIKRKQCTNFSCGDVDTFPCQQMGLYSFSQNPPAASNMEKIFPK